MGKFCTRCGSELQPGDLYCGECGQRAPGAAGDPEEPTQASPAAQPQGEDLFADWDRGIPVIPPEPPPPPDEARTESIPAAKPHDTAVLPTAQPQTPYLPPGGHPPPAGPPGPAPAQAPPRPAPAGQGFPLGAAFALLGALAVVVSALLPWTSPASFAGRLQPRDIPFTILLDPAPVLECVPSCPDPGPSLGLVLLGAGLLGALVALFTMVAPILKFLRRVIGLLTLGLVGVFVFRMVQALLVIGEVDRIWQELGVGVYVAAAGAFTQMVAGKWFRR